MDQGTYYILGACGTLGIPSLTLIGRAIFGVHKFFVNMDAKITTIKNETIPGLTRRVERIEGHLFNEGSNSSGNSGGDGGNLEAGRPHSPFNGMGFREQLGSSEDGFGDRPGILGRGDPGYSQGVVHLGPGEHA